MFSTLAYHAFPRSAKPATAAFSDEHKLPRDTASNSNDRDFASNSNDEGTTTTKTMTAPTADPTFVRILWSQLAGRSSHLNNDGKDDGNS